jgi:hypothetical protein
VHPGVIEEFDTVATLGLELLETDNPVELREEIVAALPTERVRLEILNPELYELYELYVE